MSRVLTSTDITDLCECWFDAGNDGTRLKSAHPAITMPAAVSQTSPSACCPTLPRSSRARSPAPHDHPAVRNNRRARPQSP